MIAFYTVGGWTCLLTAIYLMSLGDPNNAVGETIITALIAFLFAEIHEIQEKLK